MQLFIKTLSGHSFPIDVECTDSIEKIKELVNEKQGIPPPSQRLILNGKKLEDGKTIQDYEMKQDSTIYLALSWRGG